MKCLPPLLGVYGAIARGRFHLFLWPRSKLLSALRAAKVSVTRLDRQGYGPKVRLGGKQKLPRAKSANGLSGRSR